MDNLQASLLELEKKLRETQDYQVRQATFAKNSELRFQNNLAAFESYYPELFKQIENFKPRQDFNLFASPSGDGNFVPRDAVVPLYGDDPYQQSQCQVAKNTAKPTFGRSQLCRDVDASMKEDQRLHIRQMLNLAETIADIVSANEPDLMVLPAHYPTCIMFGLGLGYALTELLNNHTFDYLFVCEPDFETFYASLYCTEWDEIIKRIDAEGACLFLHVGTTYETFFDEIGKIYNDIGAFSLICSFCYQHTPGEKVNALIKEFFARLYEIQLGYGFYDDAVTGLAHTIENFNFNKCPVFVPHRKDSGSNQSLTAYVVANGPSLDEAIEVLKENCDNVVIFAAGTALNTLLELGIQPDFHVLVERPKDTYDILVETTDRERLNNLNLLAVDVMYPEVPPLYKWAGLGLKGPEAGTVLSQYEYYKKHQAPVLSMHYPGPLVANTALSFATTMGFGEIYMFGVDNGYPVHGLSHSRHSIYSNPEFKKKIHVDKNAPYQLEGNLTGYVNATSLMIQAKQQMESLIQSAPDTTFYNVGSGAKIKKAIPLKAEDVIFVPLNKNKIKVVEDIKNKMFQEFSIQEPETLIELDEFESLCDYLLEIGGRTYDSRKRAMALLKAQSRLVFAYRDNKHAHLFHVIKGTMLYFHGPLISLLYSYADEFKSLFFFRKAMKVWEHCILEMKKDYRHAWNRRCKYTSLK